MKRKVVFADKNYIEIYQDQVDELLSIIGYSGAWVSNMSKVGDFPEEDIDLNLVANVVGFEVKMGDYIWEVAKKMHDLGKQNG